MPRFQQAVQQYYSSYDSSGDGPPRATPYDDLDYRLPISNQSGGQVHYQYNSQVNIMDQPIDPHDLPPPCYGRDCYCRRGASYSVSEQVVISSSHHGGGPPGHFHPQHPSSARQRRSSYAPQIQGDPFNQHPSQYPEPPRPPRSSYGGYGNDTGRGHGQTRDQSRNGAHPSGYPPSYGQISRSGGRGSGPHPHNNPHPPPPPYNGQIEYESNENNNRSRPPPQNFNRQLPDSSSSRPKGFVAAPPPKQLQRPGLEYEPKKLLPPPASSSELVPYNSKHGSSTRSSSSNNAFPSSSSSGYRAIPPPGRPKPNFQAPTRKRTVSHF